MANSGFFCFNAQFRVSTVLFTKLTFFLTQYRMLPTYFALHGLEIDLKTLEVTYSLAWGLDNHPNRKMGSYIRPDLPAQTLQFSMLFLLLHHWHTKK